MNDNLRISFSEVNSTQSLQVVNFDGEFDKAGFSEIKDKITDFVKSFELKCLVFDFSILKFINSEGIGYLMEVHTHLIQRDRKLVIVGLSANVKDIFAAIGIAEIIPIFDSLNDYLKL